MLKCLLCVYHSVALEKYKDVLSLPELSLAKKQNLAMYIDTDQYTYAPTPPGHLAMSRDVSGHHT